MTSGHPATLTRPRSRLVVATVGALLVGLLPSCSLVPTDPASDGLRPASTTISTDGTKPEATSGPTASTAPTDVRPRMVAELVEQQQQALRHRDRNRYLQTFDARQQSSRHLARATYLDLRRLRVTAFTAHLLPLPSGPSTEAVTGQTWTAQVRLRWSLAGPTGSRVVRNVVTFSVVRRGDRAKVVGLSPAPGRPEPIWLTGRLHVARSTCCLVTAPEAWVAASTLRLLRRVSGDLKAYLGPWPGGLTAYVRDSSSEVAQTVGAPGAAYDGIAAVTAPISDGDGLRTPVAIVLDAEAFDAMSVGGRRALLTHEATHVATGATSSALPLWLVEGFADFVALRTVRVPVTEAAATLVSYLRRHGPPDSLPRRRDFSVGAMSLEPAYEESWLAVRLLSRLSSAQDVLRFYEDCTARPHRVARLLERRYGLSMAGFTAAWRGVLERLANG
ncbi:MAG: hypothetical protein ACR2LE_10540 [Nocardioidaceae bacterium]